MDSELIYKIGETILLELDEIENINYPRGKNLNLLILELKNGQLIKLYLKTEKTK